MHKFLLFAAALAVSSSAFAAVEPNYVPEKPPVLTPWYATQGQAERQADMDFITGMRPHHAGALTMSEEYLSSKDAANTQLKQLAKGIIHNQTFEIGMLDTVEGFVKRPIEGHSERRQIAAQGLAQKQRFIRAPMPGPLYVGDKAVTVRDVQFAKAMVIHHQAALDMARDYLANPHAVNKYLRLLCIDILTDQEMEIDFMNAVVARYQGDAAAIKIDPSMIHGMDHMSHGKGSGVAGPAHAEHDGHKAHSGHEGQGAAKKREHGHEGH